MDLRIHAKKSGHTRIWDLKHFFLVNFDPILWEWVPKAIKTIMNHMRVKNDAITAPKLWAPVWVSWCFNFPGM